MSESIRTRFLNYPTPKSYDAPFQAPPPGSNPVIKGWPLHYLANLYASPNYAIVRSINKYSVAFVPLLPSALWSNAGFGSLRKCRQLDGIDPRYDPTVIPLSQPGDGAPASYTDNTT